MRLIIANKKIELDIIEINEFNELRCIIQNDGGSYEGINLDLEKIKLISKFLNLWIKEKNNV